MPTLNLIRTVEVRADDNAPRVVVEVRPALDAGTVTAIHPAHRDRSPWRRTLLFPTGRTFLPSLDNGRGSTWATYNDLADGTYEARSVLALPRTPLRVVFRVERGEIAVLSESDDDKEVRRVLGWDRRRAATGSLFA